MKRTIPRLLSSAPLLALALAMAAQQTADPNFDPRVPRPAYKENGPEVLFDEAHQNFHTADGRYKPFADLIRSDGYVITPNKEKFSAQSLWSYDILIIANAAGGQGLEAFGKPAFTEEECAAVREWVRGGGALLLITDHPPFGAAAEALARAFGAEMGGGTVADPNHADPEAGNDGVLVFSRENGLLADHPITHGRDPDEHVSLVTTFSGQSVRGPEGSVALLRLAETAVEIPPASPEQLREARERARAQAAASGGMVRVQMPRGEARPAGGRAQGVAFTFGEGRVVILGEAGMLSAQILRGPPAQALGKEEILMGMNKPGSDNRQFALNVMRWLSRLLN
jgi:hypothetical protein